MLAYRACISVSSLAWRWYAEWIINALIIHLRIHNVSNLNSRQRLCGRLPQQFMCFAGDVIHLIEQFQKLRFQLFGRNATA